MRAFGTVDRERTAITGHVPRARWSPFAFAVQICVASLITVPAWLLGGIEPGIQYWLFVVALCAMVVCWCACLGRPTATLPLPMVLVPLALAIALGILQLVPLPLDVHKRISPTTAGLWESLDPQTPSLVDEPIADVAEGHVDTAAQERDGEWSAFLLTGGFDVPTGSRYPISLYPASTRRDLSLLILATSAFFLGAVVLSDRLGILMAGLLVAINGAALSFFGLAQQLTWNGKLFWSIPLTGGGTPFASYVNRNNAGGLLNICLACGVGVCVWAFLRNSSREAYDEARCDYGWPSKQRGVWDTLRRYARQLGLFLSGLNAVTLTGLAAAACIAAGILCSLSRGAAVAMIGAAVVTLIATVLAGRARRGWVGAVILGGVAACLLVGYLGKGNTVRQRLGTMFDEPARTALERTVHWRDGSRAAADFLHAGSGLGTYRHAYRLYQQNQYDEWFYHAENQYLEVLAETGVPGFSLLVVTIGLVALACWRLLKRATDWAGYALGIAGTFALSSQAIHAFFDFGLYMPANLLLFASVCGVVCGRAARLEERSPGLSRWPARIASILVSLPPRRPLAASCCVALFVGLLIGRGEVRQAAALDSAMRRNNEIGVGQSNALESLERSIAAFGAYPLDSAEDAGAQLQLAKLWIYRMRVQLAVAMRAGEAAGRSEQAVWKLTDTVNLHGWAQHLANQGRKVESANLRNKPSVRENLPHVLRHLRLARRSCPLLPEAHLLMAQLSVLETGDVDNRQHLERVRQTARGNPGILTRCGLLELQAGRTELACKSWRMSLELSAGQLPAIVELARPHMDLAANIPHMVPNSPELIIQIAETHFDAEDDRRIRRSLLDKAESLLSVAQFDEAERRLLLGQIASQRNAYRQAVRYFTEAVAMRPENCRWRYELAVALKHAGRLPEAQEQARVCVGTDPENQEYEALLREVIRAQLSLRRRSHAET